MMNKIEQTEPATRVSSSRSDHSTSPWKLVIAAGGTGGHISPALAIADHLARVDPQCRVEFVCGKRPVELEIYRKADVEPKAMDIRPLARRWYAWPLSIWNILRATRAARAYLRAEAPKVVLGMGGYVSVPAVLGASREGIPTMIHEQNAVAGRANRWLGRRVKAVACAYEKAADAFPPEKTRVTGNPVRREFLDGDRQAAQHRWGLREDLPTLLVFGGSQGARYLNEIVLDALARLEAAADFEGLQILWSCGERNYEELRRETERATSQRVSVCLVPFIREMGQAYAVAELALARAGAMTLAELTANGVPAILVPLPGAIAGHQRRNALPLAEAGAALVFDQDELNGERLADHFVWLISDRPRLEHMHQASERLGRRQAAEEIIDMIFELRGELP